MRRVARGHCVIASTLTLRSFSEGKQIPADLAKDAGKLRAEVEMDDLRTAVPRSHIDDEYASAGVRDPKVCITTSRDPSSRLKQFTSEVRFLSRPLLFRLASHSAPPAQVRLVFPNSQRMNRGNTTVRELVDIARKADFTDIVLLQETRGEPDALIVSHLPYGPTAHFSLSGAVMRHDIEGRGTVSEAFPHLIFQVREGPSSPQ